MPRATDTTGILQPITSIAVFIPGYGTLNPRVLPEITDSKSASYADEQVQGRSFPIKTFAHSENRVITMKWHFVVMDSNTLREAQTYVRAFQSAVYPAASNTSPYAPPPICTLQYGSVLSKDKLCVILRQYSVSYPTDVAFDENTLFAFRFDIDLSWEAVFPSSQLPNQSMILGDIPG